MRHHGPNEGFGVNGNLAAPRCQRRSSNSLPSPDEPFETPATRHDSNPVRNGPTHAQILHFVPVN